MVPIYINCNHWQIGFDKLSETLQELDLTNLMLIGDINGRIGIYQNSFFSSQWPIFNPNRKSKDTVCDKKRRRLLLELADDYDCHVQSCTGDSGSELTFIRSTASSVIDYCFISSLRNSVVSDFKVAVQTYSDHMPLEMSIVSSQTQTPNGTKQLNLIPKLHWVERNKNKFQNNLIKELNDFQESGILSTGRF